MASTLPDRLDAAADAGVRPGTELAALIEKVLAPLASLKFTVSLFAMAIFIVFAGTLAQTQQGIWTVMDEYFRVRMWPTLGFAWIDFQIFFPKSFFPNMGPVPGGFYFPGGWLIGGMLAINLLAAHGLRFKIQARGTRLYLGLAVVTLGALVTWLVIVSGSNKDGLQGAPLVSWNALWWMFLTGLMILVGIGAYAWVRLDAQQKIARWILGLAWCVVAGVTFYLVYTTATHGGEGARFSDPSMRILWQLIKGSWAALILLAGCALLFNKRAGVVLLHSGIGLMMLSEILVGTSAVEAHMLIEKGGSSNFVRDTRTLELAVIDTTDKNTDRVVAIPQSYLKNGTTITHDALPFDIEIVEFMQNSAPRALAPGEPSKADRGTGLEVTVEPKKPVPGTNDREFDLSAVYARFIDKKTEKPIGTYLVTLFYGEQDSTTKPFSIPVPETVPCDGKVWHVYLRYRRTYKPYTVKLEDVSKVDYVGTATPMKYESKIQLIDQERDVDWSTRIWMNNPLRYAGETFYQSGYHEDPDTGQKSTTLQVVTNTGWMIPYVGCMIVGWGMAAHFIVMLVTFLSRLTRAPSAENAETAGRESAVQSAREAKHRPAQRRESEKPRAAVVVAQGGFPWKRVIVPGIVVLLCAGWVLSKTRTPRSDDAGMKLYEFGRLPIAYEGRVKPFDTLARNSLRILSGKQTFLDAKGQRQPAIRWLLDVAADPEVGFKHKVILIRNLELLNTLSLERRKNGLYALDEFDDKLPELARQANQARELDPADLSAYQRKLLEFERKIGVISMLTRSLSPPRLRPESIREDVHAAIQAEQQLKANHPPLVVAPLGDNPEWETFGLVYLQNMVAGATKQEPQPSGMALTEIFAAYGDHNAAAFNRAVADYQKLLGENAKKAKIPVATVNYETYFNNMQPFYLAMPLYVTAFVLTALGWLFARSTWGPVLRSTAFWLIVFTFVVHTFALGSRMYISGRPPVTNLYSSAVFIGWGAVVLGMIFESIFKMGIGNTVSAVLGFIALGIAHFLSGDGDTFTVLQAVLDTQFWLSTHVVCITLGYATTFVSGFLGVGYILAGVCTPYLSKKLGHLLASMIHGTLCFAILFSFVGTVLGGLWADDSWGRFWGWDPKENGALIIVLWNALVLHARWGALVKERGLAMLVIGGNIVTAWSWFGVNELGVGLHSYGFTEGVLGALLAFVCTQLLLIAAAAVPKENWWSSRGQSGQLGAS